MSDIFVAPFSNSDIRDWPLDRYTELVGLLLERAGAGTGVRVIGTSGQRLRACEVVRPYPADRVFNDCGRRTWPEVVEALRSAGCVIGNNSGVCHLGGYFGAPTVCVFSGSHQRREWRPLGRSVVLVSRVIGCSPCHFDHNGGSPYRKACLKEISARTVADAAFAIMDRVAAERTGLPGGSPGGADA